AEFTIGEGELMAHDVPLGCAPDEYDDLISGTCSHLPYLCDYIAILGNIPLKPPKHAKLFRLILNRLTANRAACPFATGTVSLFTTQIEM
ncbi:hypothetical protein, partial [Enterobacter asburiae]